MQQTPTPARLLHVTTTNPPRNPAAALLGLALGVGLLSACGGGAESDPSAASPVRSTSAASVTSSAPVATPDLAPPAADPAAEAALPALVQREGAQTSALAPAVGADSPDLAVLARTEEDGVDAKITFWAWDGGAWQPQGGLTAGEPVLAQEDAEWRYLTANSYPDAVVHLQGGSMSSGVQAVIARHDASGSWRLVPLQGAHDGTDPAQDVYADDPVFDDGRIFATRAGGGGQVSASYWEYDDLDGVSSFTQIPEPDPHATETPQAP